MKRLVVLLEGGEHDRESGGTEVSATLKAAGVGYWHRMPNAWLVRDPNDRPPRFWRALVGAVCPESNILVFEVDVHSWAGKGPNEKFDWLKDKWRTPKSQRRGR